MAHVESYHRKRNPDLFRYLHKNMKLHKYPQYKCRRFYEKDSGIF